MPDRRHPYFAYGSNLCAHQMASRCPDAGAPRPAVLSDHNWLINQRGVATVEPFAGNKVHGVLWQLSERDLVRLDSAEGVPVRYRRERLTVHTDDTALPAWVYIDHRVMPGRPRPGYLPRVIDGARHHGLPQRWIDYLHRWDPARWPLPVLPSSRSGPAPQSLSELLSQPGVIETSQLRSRFGFLAIHGGGLEQVTDLIAERSAEAAGASVYLLRHPDNYPHHLPSARFDPAESARLAEFLDHVDVAVSLHGYDRIGRSEIGFVVEKLGHPGTGPVGVVVQRVARARSHVGIDELLHGIFLCGRAAGVELLLAAAVHRPRRAACA